MIKHPEKAQRYLSYYIHARSHLGDSVADAGEEMLAALLDRDALESVPTMRRQLAAEDEAFAETLADASDDWHEQLSAWAVACRFGKAPWWRAIESKTRELRSAKAV
jgi:acyl transferase domain-containing protein